MSSLVNFGTGGAGNPLGGFGGILSSLFGGLEHHAIGGTAPGVPFIAGENGPELVDAPQGAQIMTADQTNGLIGNRGGGGGGHTFNIGAPVINVAGDVSEQNRREIQAAVAAGQQQTIDHIMRNMPQIQSDARQH